MTTQTTLMGTAPSKPLFAAFHAWRAQRARNAARRAVFQQAMAELASMSPSELAEFGFSKAEFERFAWEKAYARVPE
jgi:hypothetical protein